MFKDLWPDFVQKVKKMVRTNLVLATQIYDLQ
jgi:hypothetical protein